MATIASHAEEHQSLLKELGELDYAPSALEQAQERQKTLRADVGPRTAALAKYARATKKEYDEWQRVSNNVLKRATLRVKGKDSMQERIEKEEREWLDALREESHEKDQVAMMEQEIKELDVMITDLQALTKKHEAAQKRLDSMYERVFAGPSADFPEEDSAETDVYALEKEYKDNQSKINFTAQAVNLLAKADASLIQAQKLVNQTVESIDVPLFFRGRFADYVEKESIQAAANHVARVQSYYSQARSNDINITHNFQLPNLQALATAYFDNRLFYSSISALDNVSARASSAQRSLREASMVLRQQLKETQNRHKSAEARSKNIHLRLRRARLQLDATRRQIMLDVTSLHVLTDEPESFDDSQPVEAQRSNNPYARFLASRANSVDQPDEPLPVYQPRTRAYEDLEV